MMSQEPAVVIASVTADQLPAVVALLARANLPTSDIPAERVPFLIASSSA